MNRKPTQAPRPMRKNALLSAVVGAATIVIISGNIACVPKSADNGNTLGVPNLEGVEWTGTDLTWDDYITNW